MSAAQGLIPDVRERGKEIDKIIIIKKSSYESITPENKLSTLTISYFS